MYDLVFDLMHDYLGKGQELYVGRHYTLFLLFHDLYEKLTLAVGPCQLNRRGMPLTILKNISGVSVVACRQSPILVLKWRYKRDATVFSTKHTPVI